MSDLDVLVQELRCGITADQYLTVEEDFTKCFTFDGSEAGMEAKRLALELDESSDQEEAITSIQTYDTALTLAKDLQLFLVSKGEEKAAEDQQRVISALEDAKLSARMTHAKQSSLGDFIINTS